MNKQPSKPNTINPKLIALAAKIDEAQAHCRSLDAMVETAHDQMVASKAFDKFLRLEDELARAIAANMEEMRLKARYADIEPGDYRVAESIVRDLLAMDCKPEPIASKRMAAGGVATGG